MECVDLQFAIGETLAHQKETWLDVRSEQFGSHLAELGAKAAAWIKQQKRERGCSTQAFMFDIESSNFDGLLGFGVAAKTRRAGALR